MGIEASLNFRRVDDAVTTSGTVAAEDLAQLKDGGYEAVINLMPDDSPYAVAGEADIVTGQGLGYTYIPVDFAAPTHDDLERFVAAMEANAGKALHVHCAANYRVSAFYSLYALRSGRWSLEQADALLADVWNPPGQYPVWDAFIAEERRRIEAGEP